MSCNTSSIQRTAAGFVRSKRPNDTPGSCPKRYTPPATERVRVRQQPRPVHRRFLSQRVPVRVVALVQLPVPPHALDPDGRVSYPAPVLQPKSRERHARVAKHRSDFPYFRAPARHPENDAVRVSPLRERLHAPAVLRVRGDGLGDAPRADDLPAEGVRRRRGQDRDRLVVREVKLRVRVIREEHAPRRARDVVRYRGVRRVPVPSAAHEHPVERERHRLFPSADPLLRGDDRYAFPFVLQRAVLLAHAVNPFVLIRRVPQDDLVQPHALSSSARRAHHAGNLVVPLELEREPRVGRGRERQRVRRFQFRLGFERQTLVRHVVPRRSQVAHDGQHPVRLRVVLDQHAPDDHGADRIDARRRDVLHGVERLRRRLQHASNVNLKVPGHELVDANGAVRGDEERQPRVRAPRDARGALAPVLCLRDVGRGSSRRALAVLPRVQHAELEQSFVPLDDETFAEVVRERRDVRRHPPLRGQRVVRPVRDRREQREEPEHERGREHGEAGDVQRREASASASSSPSHNRVSLVHAVVHAVVLWARRGGILPSSRVRRGRRGDWRLRRGPAPRRRRHRGVRP
eukprot:30927-Pelagococcus_subviridis.AAC.7